MVSKKVVAGLLLVYVVSMLAEQTEGFLPFFTQSDFRKMQVTHKKRTALAGALNNAGKVFLPSSPQALPVHAMPLLFSSSVPSIQTGDIMILAVPHSSQS
uniref:Uncharacterized protein n=1 Tax=Apteryx owenii TaxID=8824 RepID=A0A8B9PB80_APTOW